MSMGQGMSGVDDQVRSKSNLHQRHPLVSWRVNGSFPEAQGQGEGAASLGQTLPNSRLQHLQDHAITLGH